MLLRKAFVALSCLAIPGSAGSGATADLKAPTSYFDIRGSLPESWNAAKASVHHFKAGPDGLYFCISSGPNTLNSIILKTGWSGNRQRVFTPPQDQTLMDFDVDGHGDLYVLMNEHRRSSLLVYGADGRLQSTVPIGHFANGLSLANGKPVVLLPDRSGSQIEVLDPSGPRDIGIAIQASPRPAMTSLPDGRIVLADKAQGTVYLVNVASGTTASFTSELTSAKFGGGPPSPAQTAINRLALSSAASSPEGDIYLIAGGYRMAEGAALSRFNSQGTLIEPFRCALPTFEDMKNPDNPQGFMLPNSVGVHGNSLFLVSPQGKVAAYAR